jgi:Sulfotransferase family
MATRETLARVSSFPARDTSATFDEVSSFNRRGLFLGGCPKSGTTLLLALLDGHPELVVLPEETHFFEEGRKYHALGSFQARLRHLLECSDLRLLDQGRVGPSSDARGVDARDYLGFDHARFARLAQDFVNRPSMNLSLLLSETIRAYMITLGCDWRDCVRWVEKTPSNVPYADDLFRLFPDARLIQVVRDPRAVFASRKRRLINRYGRHAKAHRLVREWNQSSRQIKKWRDCADKFLVVRYEDLVQNSRPVLEEICRFVGIEFVPILLQPTRAGLPWQGNSTFYTAFDGIDAQPVDHWITELTQEEIWWVELHCREGMRFAGYQPHTNATFSFARWAKRLPDESLTGYLRARRASLCQLAGVLKDCNYNLTPGPSPSRIASNPVAPQPATCIRL